MRYFINKPVNMLLLKEILEIEIKKEYLYKWIIKNKLKITHKNI